MGLFLSPTSGNAIGRGASGEPPPPGIEVDTINRMPLRLLKRTMNKHVPKRMNIVPPGQQRGIMAPPYTWDALERDDWKYDLPDPRSKRKLKEALPGHPAPHPAAPDPKRARVDAIVKEIAQLRAAVVDLHSKKKAIHDLIDQGKQHIKDSGRIKQASPERAPQGHWKGSAHAGIPEIKNRVWGAPTNESLRRSRIRLLEGAPSLSDLDSLARPARAARPAVRSTGQQSPPIELATPNDPYVPTKSSQQGNVDSGWINRNERRAQLAPSQTPSGLTDQPTDKRPPQSQDVIDKAPQLATLDSQITQKQDQIQKLVDELTSIRTQMHQTHESYRLISNNLPRLNLLLK